jgi:hypothetical protein
MCLSNLRLLYDVARRLDSEAAAAGRSSSPSPATAMPTHASRPAGRGFDHDLVKPVDLTALIENHVI